MKYEIAYLDGKVYLTFKNQYIVRRFMGVIDDLAKSAHFNGNHEEARDLLDFYLDLKQAVRDMGDSEKNEEPNRP